MEVSLAKKQKDTPKGLFAEDAPRRRRPHRTLFLPRYLTQDSEKRAFEGPAQDRAYAMICKWADLETRGDLPDFGETEVDAIFLTEVFGSLGYAIKTANPGDYQLEVKWHVAGTGIADGALGAFPGAASPTAVIELKGSKTDLDTDKSGGRTAVQQCWDYLTGLPECPWAIVSNFSTIRLYHRNKTRMAYEEFTLQELRRRGRFNEFYYVMHLRGLVPFKAAAKSLAQELLDRTTTNEKQVGDKLYAEYQLWRNRLIEHLVKVVGKSFDAAVRIAQKLLDRIIFIAFCEDRGLLPPRALEKAYNYEPIYGRTGYRKWQSFLALFHEVDGGGEGVQLAVGFNGGLFKTDEEIDELNLEDVPWMAAFKGFGDWDFKDEVNVDVLGHLFERSITELEKLRKGGLPALIQGAEPAPGPTMPKSAQRKRFGIYYTPPAFTGLIVERTIDALLRERFVALAASCGVDPDSGKTEAGTPSPDYWRACLAVLRDLKVVDPACGSGAFLIRTYESLELHYYWAIEGLIASGGVSRAELNGVADHVPEWILSDNLHGVDISQEAVEITQLALWIRSARPNKTLSDLSANIIRGNSLVEDPAVHEQAMRWKEKFPGVFGRGGDRAGFDCVIGNPPWERVKLQEREFFSLTDPETAQSVSAADRRKRIEAMPKVNPELFAAYQRALGQTDRLLTHARGSGEYPLTGKGDVNLYMLFAELASKLVSDSGLMGLLVPSGIATDETTKEFFGGLMARKALVSFYDFENRNKVFEDVDGRFKFSALVFNGKGRRSDKADFVFFAHEVEDVSPQHKKRHIPLTAADMALVNPNTKTCPVFRTRRDAELTKGVYKRVPILIDENRRQGGNPWGIKFFTMFHQTSHAELFHDEVYWKKAGYRLFGSHFKKGKKSALPLYEAKMVQAFDHRAASVLIEDENWVRQGQKNTTSRVEHGNPEFASMPRWWVDETEMPEEPNEPWFLAYKDITSSTNERTMIAAFLPRVAVVNSAPLMLVGKDIQPRRECCLLADLNSFAYDFVARQKVGGNHLNFFIVEQLPTIPPDRYDDPCPWGDTKKETLEHWISERVLKLSCTAEDMIPLAKACGFKGSRGDGVHLWKEAERARLRAELDAAFFHLYEIEREDVEYILTTFTNTGRRKEADLSGDESAWLPGDAGDLILRAYDGMLLP